MDLHLSKDLFHDLCVLTSEYIGIPYEAIKKDYFIILILESIGFLLSNKKTNRRIFWKVKKQLTLI